MVEPLHPHQKFYEAWRLDVGYRESERTAALDRATQFALLGLKLALGMNGSAILAVPIFIELVGKNELWAPNSWQIALAVGAFGLGLIFASISVFCAYSGQSAIGNEQSFRRSAAANTTIRDYIRDISGGAVKEPISDDGKEFIAMITEDKETAIKHFNAANKWIMWAEMLYGLSMFCFLIGAGFFGASLSTAMGLFGGSVP